MTNPTKPRAEFTPDRLVEPLLRDVVKMVDEAVSVSTTIAAERKKIEAEISEVERDGTLSPIEAAERASTLRDALRICDDRYTAALKLVGTARRQAKAAELAALKSPGGLAARRALLRERPNSTALRAALDEVERLVREVEADDRSLVFSIRAEAGREALGFETRRSGLASVALGELRSYTELCPVVLDDVVERSFRGEISPAELDERTVEQICSKMSPSQRVAWISQEPQRIPASKPRRKTGTPETGTGEKTGETVGEAVPA